MIYNDSYIPIQVLIARSHFFFTLFFIKFWNNINGVLLS